MKVGPYLSCIKVKVKVKQSHYSPWTGPEGSMKVEASRFQDNPTHEYGKAVSTHAPAAFTPTGNIPGTYFY
jgi:hypothetical protein